ncbi:MAG: Gfo/Idh/MocA family oxidoreductase [Armatimonadetes bacterium]|nr:Gfo/Idh/MocA family oxidoreductase [Armatimonadota bacterium]
MSQRINRRQFLGTAGAAALSSSALANSLGPRASDFGPDSISFPEPTPAQNQKTMAGYAAPKLDKVRVGFIGVGARGSGHVAQMLQIDGVEVKAIADLYPDWAENSANRCVKAGRPKPTIYGPGKDSYKAMLDRDDIDIAIISTPWEEHARMAVDAMNRGKHAFIEVPACVTLDECWQLVETSEKTHKHCMMMENCCYGREELLVLHMARLGLFGELLHGEAAYIHDLRGQMHEIERGTGSWRTPHYIKRNGNLYATHGLGPVCQYMGINRGDRMDFLSSVSSNSRVRAQYAKDNFPPDHKWNKAKFICGDINTTIIRTVMGKTIMVQWDEQLPRPYNRLNLLQGTRGVFGGYPNRMVIEAPKGTQDAQNRLLATKSADGWTEDAELGKWFQKYDHPLYTKVKNLPGNLGGHGDMDFIMLWRMVYCLRNGLPLDQDVYDAAAWSAISPLSEVSVARRGRSVDVPDFTRGVWKNVPELGIVA